mgnify:CR=1 FL=1
MTFLSRKTETVKTNEWMVICELFIVWLQSIFFLNNNNNNKVRIIHYYDYEKFLFSGKRWKKKRKAQVWSWNFNLTTSAIEFIHKDNKFDHHVAYIIIMIVSILQFSEEKKFVFPFRYHQFRIMTNNKTHTDFCRRHEKIDVPLDKHIWKQI